MSVSWGTVPMPSIEPVFDLSPKTQQTLLTLARQAISHGLHHEETFPLDLQQFDSQLTNKGCCFVTLHISGQLRGCMGALSASQALVKDLIEHAYAAAFRDPRFPRVSAEELPKLHIEIAILTPLSPILCHSEAELLEQLQPFKDGLVLEDEHYRATFLPSVWEHLPDKIQFLRELKRKAGMPADYWSDSLKAYRYHTLTFSE